MPSPPTEPPEWNEADRAGSFRAYAEWLNETARMTFLKDKTHVELFFLVRPDGAAGMGAPPPDMDRDQVAGMLKESIREHGIYGLVHILEAWMYFPRQPGDHTFQQVLQGEIRVSELRPEDRKEAVIVHCQSREGANTMWMSRIIRLGQDVALADAIEWRDPPGGRFGRLFVA